jgi:LL-diaminopimelate aminotransferase
MTATATSPIRQLYARQCQTMVPYIMFRIARRVNDLTDSLTAKGRAPLKMSIGAPTAHPPKALLDKVKTLLDEPGIHTYSVPEGEAFFRDAVAQRMQTRFGVDINPKTEVCSLIGSKEGLAQLFRGLITPSFNRDEQDIILTPDPGYASYVDAIAIAGGISYPTPLKPEHQYLPDLDGLDAQLQADGLDPKKVKALIVNYPSNPIGAMCDVAFYEKAVAFCKQRGILLISDLAYSEMVFSGEAKPHSVLEVAGAKDWAIEFHSMSKPYALTGWRIGFAVGNADAVNLVSMVKSTVDSGLFKVLQKATAFALTSPECEAYVQQMNGVYERNQARAVAGFKSLGWPMDHISPPRATFYLWLPIPPRYKSCEQFTDELLETSGIVAVPGTAFGQYGEGFMRLSLVTPEAELDEVISRMKTDGFTWE